MKVRSGPRVFVSAACVLTMVAGLASAADQASGVLRLKTGDVPTHAGTNILARAAVPVDITRQAAVVQLDGPMTPARRDALTKAGVVLFEYLPDHAYTADIRRADLAALRALDFVTWVGTYDNAWKISPELGQVPVQSAERVAIAQQGRLAVNIMLWPNAHVPSTIDRLAAIPGISIDGSGWSGRETTIEATIPADAAAAIAAIPNVMWIENTPELTFRNATVRWIVQSNVSGSFPIHDRGIRGQGQIVGIMDGKVNVNHCSFSDTDPIGPNHRKIAAYNTTLGSDSHGTHVAGTAVGDDGTTTDRRGVAYQARFVFNTISTASTSFLARLNQHYSQGAAVHTNSWGNDGTTSYDSLARSIDVFSYDNDDNLVIFAVTNLSTLKNPENAKNVLAVGASQDTPNQANFCSGGQGPTNDGRRKPEIYSPGCNTASSSSSSTCSTVQFTGTSMAAPSIAGSALLARQYYTDGFYPTGVATPSDGFTPSGALVKATLLNSTVDMTGVSGYPSNREGWGRVLLANSLLFDDSSRSIIIRDVRNNSEGALSTSDVVEVEFEVFSFQPLKVTLVWHDAPAAVSANPAAINNLNLTINGPIGEFKGNVFSGGNSTTGGSYDVNNNVEMLQFPAVSPGIYTVRIDAAAVNVGSQGYALVITGDVAEVSPPDDCIADWNDDTLLDFFDITGYLASFAAQDPAADLNNDAMWDFFDITAFLGAFANGCP